ncbi:Tetratricopeptide repeat like superfamily protein [Klebsormidium nitens]|uniref:Tetratricopeptide repeat like superfamily protein n=1 Tax=Klebsormidium nitens TaxID=105231 RepID=A0A1Y1HZN2_KLENI|nr:Tetratricopeptide repeat like superfamily protein [Klebsormidium nitens]|eukprot:GAQ83192.1 Tetratricopeptide repeat like superfamily protein [Klebsormidium nitens]
MPTAPKASYEEPPLGRRDALFVGVAGAALSALVGAAVMLQPVDVAQAYLGGGPYGRQVTRGQDLSGQDFSNLDLTGQDFKTSILRQTTFKNSKLAGASFFDADLAGADFSNTDLRGADFSLCRATQVNFTGAIFEGATVTGNTQFKGSNVTDTDFTDVGLRTDQRKLLCKIASGTNPVTGVDTRESLLCGD